MAPSEGERGVYPVVLNQEQGLGRTGRFANDEPTCMDGTFPALLYALVR